MLHLAILGGGLLDNAQGHFDPLSYFFGAGISTNIGAAAVGLGLGYLWGRAKLKALHGRLDALHASHRDLHAKLDALTPVDGAGPASASPLG